MPCTVLLLLVGIAGQDAPTTVDLTVALHDWAAGTDSGDTTMLLSAIEEAPIVVDIRADGVGEDYPKVSRAWASPQDWTRYMRLHARVKVACDDPDLPTRTIAFVFYDRQTLREDLPDRPMTQQVIARSVPVGEWVELSLWLLDIRRSAIAALAVYLYEQPCSRAYSARWEFAELRIEGVDEAAVLFDTEAYKADALTGQMGVEAVNVHTEDGLDLGIGASGELVRVSQGGREIGSASGAVTGLLVRDAGGDDPPVAVGGTVSRTGARARQESVLSEVGLAVEADYTPTGGFIEVAGVVRDLRGKDRAVTVYLALPLSSGPWQWWDSVAQARGAEDSGDAELAYYESGLEYGTKGTHSKYPLGAVTLDGVGGLALAVRMDEPVVHRIAYNPALRVIYIAADFGLTPLMTEKGRSLSEAPFRFIVYAVDPGWGFRAALERYYGFFPQFFEKRTTRDGGWYVWGDMSQTPGALEAGFQFHWGPSGRDAVTWDNDHGVTVVQYIEPELFQLTMGDLDRAPTSTEALERVRRLATGDPEELAAFERLGYSRSYAPGLWAAEHTLHAMFEAVARAADASAIHDPAGRIPLQPGQFPWMSESQWGVMFPCNLDPDIPAGKGQFCRDVYLDTGMREMAMGGARYDGVGLDSFGGYGMCHRANYRREHFRYADIPLTFGVASRRPVQAAAFASIEWLRELAADYHSRGLLLMTNCSWHHTPGWLSFAAPYLDVFGAEAPRFADPDFIRAIARRKACTDLPYDPRPDWEVEWHLLHAIFPGHGNDLEVMARYAALLRELSEAGWEPVTHARAEPAEVRLERYGRGSQTYIVAHNPSDATTQVSISVDATALGLGGLSARDALTGDELRSNGTSVQLRLEPRRTVAVLLRAP